MERALLAPAELPALLLPVRVATRFAVRSKSRDGGWQFGPTTEGLPTYLLVRVYPDDLHVHASDYTAVARLLPDRWVVTLWTDGAQGLSAALSVGGEPVGTEGVLPLVTGPDTPSADWPSDFNAALKVGMAVAVELPEGLRRGVDLLTVVGLRDSGSGELGRAQLTAAMEDWIRSKKLSFLAPGTPTNAHSAVRPGFDSAASEVSPDAELSLLQARELQASQTTPPLPADAEGAHLALALGLDPSLFTSTPGAERQRDRDARNMLELLWPVTLGIWAEKVAHPALADYGRSGPDWQSALRSHALSYLRPAGWLPTLGLERQPYGLLPVMLGSGDEDYTSLWNRLWPSIMELRRTLLDLARARVPRRGRGDPLVLILRRGLTSRGVRVRERRNYPPSAAGGDINVIWSDLCSLNNFNRIRTDLEGSAPTGLGWYDTLQDHVGVSLHTVSPLLQPGQAPTLPRFSEALPVNRPLLDFPLWMSIVHERASVAFRTYASGAPRRWALPRLNVAEFLAWNAHQASVETWSRIPPFIVELQELGRRDEAALDRLFCETLDVASGRLDAWLSSLALQSLLERRRQQPLGLLLGGFGLVEKLAWRPEREPALPDGYLLAPTRKSAAAAAILKNAADGLEADDSSDAVRRALEIDLSAPRAREAEATLRGSAAPWSDAAADLGIAELAARLSDGDISGVGALSDALFRGAGPPPRLSLLETSSGGPAIKHKVAVRIPLDAEPPGWPPAWPSLPTLAQRTRSPRASAHPALNAWLGWIFGPPDQIFFQLDRGEGAPETHSLAELWTDAGAAAGCPALEPLDLYALVSADSLEAWLCLRLGVAMGARPARAVLSGGGASGPEELRLIVALLRPVLAQARALNAEALALQTPPVADADGALRLAGEESVRLARQALTRVLGLANGASPPARFIGPGPLLRRRWGAIALQGALLHPPPKLPDILDNESIDATLRALLDQLSPRPVSGPVPENPEEARAILTALLGLDLPLQLAHSASQAPTLSAPLSPTPSTAVRDWLVAVSAVRPACAALWDLLASREALRGESAPLAPAQALDGEQTTAWVGAINPSYTLTKDAVSVVWHAPLGLGDRFTGWLLDEWFEWLPAPEPRLGLAARVDQPAQQAPQAMLLGVHPSGRGTWTEGDLSRLVAEAFDLTRLRALAPEDIPENATFPAILVDLDATEILF